MQRFKYKFKNYVYVVMVAAILLALLTIAMTFYRLIKNGYDPSHLLGLITTLLISVLIIVLIVSMLISSYYEVNDKNFVLRWGILKNVIPIKEITKTVHNPETDKLTVYFGENDNFMIISVVKVNPLDIVDALRSKNKKIMFESISSEHDKTDKK